MGNIVQRSFIINCILLLLLLSASLPAEEYWQQTVNYTMDVELHPDDRLIKAKSKIVYINNSPDSLDRIYLHLYPRAFQAGSVKYHEYLRGQGGQRRAAGFIHNLEQIEHSFSITSYNLIGNRIGQTSEFKIDDTILKTELPDMLIPGDSLTIEIEWDHIVGRQLERSGYVRDQFNMAQWYPKVVVYDDQGWHNEPFHAEGEFYGEYGSFDVTLSLPEKYIIGATGVVIEGDPGWESVKVDTSWNYQEWLQLFHAIKSASESDQIRKVRFYADNVHDFAWIASPYCLYEHGVWQGIDINVLYNKNHAERWSKTVFERSKRAIGWLSSTVGMYAYPQITIADRIVGGGMEYPMLVMNGSASEGLIVHEIAHNWFYGILGNNEVDEAWLDEGFADLLTNWYLEARYPVGRDLSLARRYKNFQKRFWHFTSLTDENQWSALDLMSSAFDEPVSRPSYLYKNAYTYRNNVYTKASVMLQELKYVVGDSIFSAGLKEYYYRWKNKHVNEERFSSAMEKVYAKDLDWFFDSWLHATHVTDYAIIDWQSEEQSDKSWLVTVEIENYGQRDLPVMIETKLQDGSKIRKRWNNHLGKGSGSFSFSVPSKPKKIRLDPDGQTADLDLRNNSTGFPRYDITYRWPGMNYNPRDRVILLVSPLMYYHAETGSMPGLWITTQYGSLENHNIKINYSTKSGDLFLNINGKIQVGRALTRKYLTYHIFDESGIKGYGLGTIINWTKNYRSNPNHSIQIGFYTENADKSNYTDLYEPGRTSVISSSYNLRSPGKKFNATFAIAPSEIADWSFIKLHSELNLNFGTNTLMTRSRFFTGFAWSTGATIPLQERFQISGAGSRMQFRKAYLRDQSSLFDLDDLRSQHYLPGDTNLRGYYDHGFSGAEKTISNSIESIYKFPLSNMTIEMKIFVDEGFVWGINAVNDSKNYNGKLLADAGFGVNFTQPILGHKIFIGLDFPIWVSAPKPGEEMLDLKRWSFTLTKVR